MEEERFSLDIAAESMMKGILRGTGMVGKAMAIDLSREFHVTAVDKDPSALSALKDNFPGQMITADLAQPETIADLVAGQAPVLVAVPGFMGYRTLEAIIATGVDCINISFFWKIPAASTPWCKRKRSQWWLTPAW